MSKIKKMHFVDNADGSNVETTTINTTSPQTDIYTIFKENDGWMSIKDVIKYIGGDPCSQTQIVKASRIVKSLWKRDFLIREKNTDVVWGHEFKFKFCTFPKFDTSLML